MTATDRRIEALHPDLQPLAIKLLHAAAAAGMPILITETLRSRERQAELYAQGRTAPGKIVTRARPGESRHETGRAFDVAFHGADGRPTWDGPWEDLGALAESIGLAWGGRWKRPDRPHIELPEAQPEPRTLRRGDSGPDVEALHDTLVRLGLMGPSKLYNRRLFTRTMYESVRYFQGERGLAVDGIVGSATRAALAKALEGKS